jgi:hypothetical protein
VWSSRISLINLQLFAYIDKYNIGRFSTVIICGHELREILTGFLVLLLRDRSDGPVQRHLHVIAENPYLIGDRAVGVRGRTGEIHLVILQVCQVCYRRHPGNIFSAYCLAGSRCRSGPRRTSHLQLVSFRRRQGRRRGS